MTVDCCLRLETPEVPQDVSDELNLSLVVRQREDEIKNLVKVILEELKMRYFSNMYCFSEKKAKI